MRDAGDAWDVEDVWDVEDRNEDRERTPCSKAYAILNQ